MADLLADLNPAQLRAVVHGDGPLLVLAGPGSGKTRVITRRIAYGLRTGRLTPRRVLGITFTNRAAEEMKARIRAMLTDEVDVPLGTFHWVGHAILRRHIHRLGYHRTFRLLGPGEARQVLRQAMRRDGEETQLGVARAAAAISAVKNGAALLAAAQRHGCAAPYLESLSGRYEAQLLATNALDLDDLLRLSALLLHQDAEVRSLCRQAHDEILVDEYQDTNPVQQELLTLLAPESGRVVAVGDEDQAIYGWRQAGSRSFQAFARDFPGTEIVALEQTYRSSKRILRAASDLIDYNPDRLPKRLRTDNPAGERPICFVAGDEVEEANWIAREAQRIAAERKLPWQAFAVLYRTNAQSRAIEDALVRAGVPYHVVSGHRFYDRPEVRHALCYLRLALDPADDEAALELAGSLWGVGPARRELLATAARQNQGTVLDALTSPQIAGAVPGQVRDRLQKLRQRVREVVARRDQRLIEVVDAAVAATAVDVSAATPAEYDAALEDLGELRSMAAEFSSGRGTLRAFVDRLALSGDRRDNGAGGRLMSLHAAKGLEFPVVFLAGLEEGLLPHRRSLDHPAEVEEERRLCYVGMTRAESVLRLSYAHTRVLDGQALLGLPSRFLAEMGRHSVDVQVSSAARTRPRLHHVSPGERVSHARWGTGTVLAVEGAGRDTLVSIQFDGAGRQRLQLCHAPLQRLSEEREDVLAG